MKRDTSRKSLRAAKERNDAFWLRRTRWSPAFVAPRTIDCVPRGMLSLYNSSTMCSVEFLEIECFSSSRCASSFLTHEKRFSLLSFVKPGWSTTGRVPVRALRATHPIHRPIWVCLIRRLLRRSRVRFLPNRTREQTPTKSVGRKAQRESDISSIFTSRGR